MISIVIPCYNVAPWLEECVESVLNVGSEIEIILVNNNSSDGTPDIIQRLTGQRGIRAVDEPRPGAPAARNRGLKEVQGAYVQFLDADDLILPGKFQQQLSQPADVMAGSYIRRRTDGSEQIQEVTEDVWKGLFDTRYGITSSNLFRTEAVRAVSGWDENLGSSQEYDLMFRMLSNGGSTSICQDALAVVRERESGQISQGNAAERWQRYLGLRERILEYLKTQRSDYFQQEADYYYQALFDQIRILSNADSTAAIRKYHEWIPRNFKPKPSPATGQGFLYLMRVIGFAGATRLKRLLK